MKRLIFIIFVAISTNICAQHLKFKGIPLEGTLTNFVTQLKAKGLAYLGTEDGIALLQGEFAGYKNCIVGVSTFEGTQNVCRVTSLFPEKENWSDITSDYFGLKSLLTEKYGKPESIEIFSDREPSSDALRFISLTHGECNYRSTFITEGGKIILSMRGKEYNTAQVILEYFDNENAAKVRQQILDDL